MPRVPLDLLQQGRVEVYLSRATIKELRKVLQYPSVRRLVDLDEQRKNTFIRKMMFRGVLLRRVAHVFDYPRAKADEPYIDLAAAANADFLVTRDKDLLSLATDPSFIGKQFRQRLPHLRVMDLFHFSKRLDRCSRLDFATFGRWS